MSIGEIVAIFIGVVAVLGLIGTWVKNGRASSSEFGGLKADLNNINGKLDDPSHGLGALSDKMGDFQTTCALTRSAFTEQIKNAKEDIKELKKKRR